MGRAMPRADGGCRISKRRIGDSLRRLRAGRSHASLHSVTLSPVTPVLEAAFAAQPGGTGHVYSRHTRTLRRERGHLQVHRRWGDGLVLGPAVHRAQTSNYPREEGAHEAELGGVRPSGLQPADTGLPRVRIARVRPLVRADEELDGSAVTDHELYAYSHIMIADRMWAQGNIAMANTKTAFKRWYTREFLGYEYGGNPDIIVNENAVAIRLERQAGSPEDFQIIELDTGHNSKYRPEPGSRPSSVISPRSRSGSPSAPRTPSSRGRTPSTPSRGPNTTSSAPPTMRRSTTSSSTERAR